MKKVKFEYQAIVGGYIASKWELEDNAWLFVGKQFGATKKEARESFDFDAEDYFS